MTNQPSRDWLATAEAHIEGLHQLTNDPGAGGAIATGCAAIASAILAAGFQEELLTVEELGATDLPRDAEHRALDDPRFADRCGHHWIVVELQDGHRRLRLHECFQAKGHVKDGYPETPVNVHQCVCGLLRVHE